MIEIDIAGEYGVNDGSIHIRKDGEEVVMWDSAEWIEDPSLVYVIVNAVREAYDPGPRPMHETRARQPGDACQLIGDYKVRHIAPCADGHATGVVTDVRTGKIVERP